MRNTQKKKYVIGLVVAVLLLGLGLYLGPDNLMNGDLNRASDPYVLSTQSINFIPTIAGYSVRQSFTVTNVSNHVVHFRWFAAPNDEVFTLSDGRNFDIGVGAHRTFEVSFHPLRNIDNVYRTSAILVGDGAFKSINIVARGLPAYRVFPTEVNFLRTVVGVTSQRDVTIQNYTGATLTVGASAPRSSQYRIVDVQNVPPRSTGTVRFSFTPRVPGGFSEVEPNILIISGYGDRQNRESRVDLTFNSVGVAR